MKITTTITFPTGHKAEQDHYRLRLALAYWRWLLAMRWTAFRAKGWGVPFTVRVKVTGTWPQRTLTRATRLLRTAWERRDPRYVVVAYSVDRYCADQIEGGRWFNTYTLEEARKCWRKSSIQPLMDALEADYPDTGRRYSVLGGDDFSIRYLDRFDANPSFIDTYVPYS